MTDGQEEEPGVVPRPPQPYLRSDAQARLAARIIASRGARRERALLTVCAVMSALILVVSGSAWALTGYLNGHIKRVDAGTANSASTGPLNILVAGWTRGPALPITRRSCCTSATTSPPTPTR